MKRVFKWITIVGTYLVAFTYVAYRVVKDHRFWRRYLRGSPRALTTLIMDLGYAIGVWRRKG
jgi:hypothetical protein